MKPTYNEALNALVESYWQMNEIRLYLESRGDYPKSKLVAKAQDNLLIVQDHFKGEPKMQLEMSFND